MKKIIRITALVVIIALCMGACSFGGETKMENTKVKFEMDDGSYFVAELYPEYAPKTVENFVKLVGEGFYDGLTFHRVIQGFMVQGGCPNGTGMGGSDEKIKGEFSSNGYSKNTLSHKTGVISMARSQHPDSASSQFFICVADCEYLDGDYAAFGEIIEGMDSVHAIAAVKTNLNDKPLTPVVMKKVTIIQ